MQAYPIQANRPARPESPIVGCHHADGSVATLVDVGHAVTVGVHGVPLGDASVPPVAGEEDDGCCRRRERLRDHDGDLGVVIVRTLGVWPQTRRTAP